MRLTQIAESKGLSIRAFEEFCGLKRGNISNILPGGAIGSDKLARIFDALPGLNPIWLISGTGDMYMGEGASADTQACVTIIGENKLLREQLKEKDQTIQEQAKEIGRLEARLEQFELITAGKNDPAHYHAQPAAQPAP